MKNNELTLQDTMATESITKAAIEPVYDIAQIIGGLYGDGFIALKNAFSREWVAQLHEDVLMA